MGRLSEVEFRRHELPGRCLTYTGACLPTRKDWVNSLLTVGREYKVDE